MKKRSDINIFLDSILAGMGLMDFRAFESVAWFAYDPLIARSWTKRVLKMIDDLDKTPLTAKEKALLFTTVSQIRCSAQFDLWASKYAKVGRKERVKIFSFYRKLLRAVCTEDPFALKSNRKHSERDIKKFLSDLTPASPQDAKLLGRVVSACYHLSHAMYSDMNPQIVYDNYGPYLVKYKGDEYLLAIKEFGHLRALELWQESKNIPHTHIQGVYLYKRSVKMRVDAISHAVYEGNLIGDLAHYALIIDGKSHPIENTEKLATIIEKQAARIYEKVQSATPERKKEIYYFQKAYAYKNIHDYLGQPWQPGQDVLEEAKGKPLYHVRWSEDVRQQKKVLRKTFDPCIDFVA